MSVRSSKVLMLILGTMLVLAVARCGSNESTADAGTSPPDAGQKPGDDAGQEPDAGFEEDAGDAGQDDAGVEPEVVETTVPAINDLQDAEHPEAGARVSFTAVAAGPRFLLRADPSGETCTWGLFVADATAEQPEHNGVLLTAAGTYDATAKKCNDDSSLHVGEQAEEWGVGEEIEVVGEYTEYCGNPNPDRTCKDRDSSQKEIRVPQVAIKAAADLKRTGSTPGLPDSLPVVVPVAGVASVGTQSPYTLGADFWKYRAVLVKLEILEVADIHSGETSCEFSVVESGTTEPRLRVDDAFFPTETCEFKPWTAGITIYEMTGFLHWDAGSAKVLPRAVDDSDPELPGPIQTKTITVINDLEHPDHPQENAPVKFNGVVASRIWLVEPAPPEEPKGTCLYGMFMADRESGTAENNGVLVVAEATVNEQFKSCNLNSALHEVLMEEGVVIGDLFEVKGRFSEYCPKKGPQCQDAFGGRGLTMPYVRVGKPADLKRLGHPGVLGYTPPVVTPEEINSTREGGAVTGLGDKWWKYRGALVKLEGVKVVNGNPDASSEKDLCEWGVATIGKTEPMLRVDDGVLGWVDGTCPRRPAVGTEYQSLVGFVYWAQGSAKLLPRLNDECDPPLP